MIFSPTKVSHGSFTAWTAASTTFSSTRRKTRAPLNGRSSKRFPQKSLLARARTPTGPGQSSSSAIKSSQFIASRALTLSASTQLPKSSPRSLRTLVSLPAKISSIPSALPPRSFALSMRHFKQPPTGLAAKLNTKRLMQTSLAASIFGISSPFQTSPKTFHGMIQSTVSRLTHRPLSLRSVSRSRSRILQKQSLYRMKVAIFARPQRVTS